MVGDVMNTNERPFRALADLIKGSRLSKGLTQRQLSRALDKSDGYVGHLESGRVRPTAETLKALSMVLGVVYGQLAVDAGYITREEFDSPIDEGQLARLSEVSDLTETEWESVKDFARYIRSRRTPPR